MTIQKHLPQMVFMITSVKCCHSPFSMMPSGKETVTESCGVGRSFFHCSRLPGGRTSYSIEAFNLLAQFNVILPPRLAQQLAWSRCINTKGQIGCNILCDLHMGHLNQSCKEAIKGLDANVSTCVPLKLFRVLADTLDHLQLHANNLTKVSAFH